MFRCKISEEDKKKNNLFEHGVFKIESSTDIANIIKEHRMNKFVQKLFLKKHQRALFTYFKSNILKDDIFIGKVQTKMKLFS